LAELVKALEEKFGMAFQKPFSFYTTLLKTFFRER